VQGFQDREHEDSDFIFVSNEVSVLDNNRETVEATCLLIKKDMFEFELNFKA
jgi:hypothetical protein